MQLTLKFFATFREAVGSKLAEREVPEGATVGDVLADLEAEYDGLAGELIEDGELRPQINVLLDGREVLHMEGIDTALSDGDTLAIFPPVAGGADCANAESDERVESYRGISRRLAVRYLRNLGGETDAPDEEATTVTGDGWRAELSAEKVNAGGSLTLTEVTVRFAGDAATLDDLVPAFDRKAMRAGG